MKRKVYLLALIVVGLYAAIAVAGRGLYFDTDSIPPTLLTPPPAVGSPGWQADIAQIVAMQKSPDPEALKEAAEERTVPPKLFVQTVAPQITREAYPHTYHLLERANMTTQMVTSQAKDYYDTKRPYLASPDVKALIEPHDNPSYPSGHASGMYVWAYIMGMLQPDHRDAYLARAKQIAQHRVLVGMHYPTDIRAGREISLLVMGALLQSPDFQQDLDAARAEFAVTPVEMAPAR